MADTERSVAGCIKARLAAWVLILAVPLLAVPPLTLAAKPPQDSGTARPCLRWEVEEGVKVNRQRAERLYRVACGWVERNIWPQGRAVRTCVTIRVGKPCPDGRASGCINVSQRTIYLPAWDQRAPGQVVQGVLLLALVERFERKIVKEVARELLDKDFQGYVDVY